jgi:transposase
MMNMMYVGIDIAKKSFDLNFYNRKKVWHFEYDNENIKKCLELLTKNNTKLVVLEATGGYEQKLVIALQAAELQVAVANPKRVRDFAKAKGILAKTDRIDARVIADYAATLKPLPSQPVSPDSLKLKALITRRHQLIKMKTVEDNHSEHADDKIVANSIKAVIRTIEREIKKVEQQIDDLFDNMPELKRKAEIMQSVKGIGKTTAVMLAVELPELGHCSRSQIAALTGTAPINDDSGTIKKKRITRGGRRSIKARLFMPILSVAYRNAKLNKFYQRLLKKGKTKKAALTAVMRKILVILNALIRKNQMWGVNTA